MALLFMPQTAMMWTSSGHSNSALVDNLIRDQVVKDARVASAMRAVDRADFCPPGGRPYDDSPMPIGYGQTISAPHMHAHALELLKEHLKPGSKVLDVGVGSGILAAMMAHMVGEHGKVVSIDFPELVSLAERNLLKSCAQQLGGPSPTIQLHAADGWRGVPDEAPFAAIHVGAAAASVPQALLDQLEPGGRMLIPVGPEGGAQALCVVDKSRDGTVTQTAQMSVRFVPLVRTAGGA